MWWLILLFLDGRETFARGLVAPSGLAGLVVHLDKKRPRSGPGLNCEATFVILPAREAPD